MTIYYGGMVGVKFELGDVDPFAILVSYHNLSPSWEAPWFASETMLDSGAFSAWRKGVTIDLEAYAEFLREHGSRFSVWVGLDLIGDAERTWENYCRMKELGLNVMPVFHLGQDLRWLRRYVRKTNYSGLGDVASVYKSRRMTLLDRVFTDFPDSTEIGFHGFGVNDPTLILRYPWKSIDATSAHRLARTGCVKTALGQRQIIPNGVESGWQSEGKLKSMLSHLESIGIDPLKVVEPTIEGTKERCRANIIRFESLAAQCPDRFGHGRDYLL